MTDKDGGETVPGKRRGGPRTRRGKRRASLNALKHGLRSKRPEAAGLNTAAFRAFRWRLEREWAPASDEERFLVRRYADISWRIKKSWEEEVRIFEGAREGYVGRGGYARVFLDPKWASALDQWLDRKEVLDREMEPVMAALIRLRTRGTTAEPRETEKPQTNSLDAELLESLRKRAGGDFEPRDSRSFEGVPGIVARKPILPN